jgi:hypothetical protein
MRFRGPPALKDRFEGEYPLPRYGGECAASTASLWINHMPLGQPEKATGHEFPQIEPWLALRHHTGCPRQKPKASSHRQP